MHYRWLANLHLLGVGAMPSRSEPISSSFPSSLTSPPNDFFSLSELLEESTAKKIKEGREGGPRGREGGREGGRVKVILS